MQTITPEGFAALKNRALHSILIGAYLGKPYNVAFFQGHLNLLQALERGNADFAAHKDARLGGYEPFAGFEAAWAALPPGIERMAMAQVQQHLRAHGVELAPYAIANGELNGVFQVKDGEVSVIDRNNEAHQASVESHNGSGLHGQPSSAATVAQGVAA